MKMKAMNGLFQTKCNPFSRTLHGLTALALTLSATTGLAAPGPLSQTPLFLAQPVQPNIFFMLDDSGSMDWEVLKSSGAIAVHGTGTNSGNLDLQPEDNAEFWELCAGYNVLAYDPNISYTPWRGTDRSGAAFADQDIGAAMVNPYTGHTNENACHSNGFVDNGNGRVCDLISDFNGGEGVFYYVWNDADGDGVYDNGECPRDGTNRADPGNRIYVSTLSAEEQTNYANWFSYYRKREYVMKRAVSQVIEESGERMGMGTLNRNNHVTRGTEVGTQVKDVDNLTLPINATAVQNKATLLDNLLGVNSSSGTPLRQGLEHVGEYFMNQMSDGSLFGFTPSADSDSAAGHSPILSAELGGVCQQNFAIVLSDGFWNGNDPSVGNADSGSGPFDGQSYADSVSNTLADVAMHYYETDLLDIADEVPPVRILNGVDDEAECQTADFISNPNCADINEQQHLVTFTVAFGLTGTIPETDANGDPCIPGSRTGSLASQNWPTRCDASLSAGWPTPVANNVTTVDDMMHAAWNGRGLFLSAKDPEQLILRLQQAIGDIGARRPPTAAAVAVDTFNIIDGGHVFQGRFDSSYWTGELYGMTIENDVITGNDWEAHEQLTSRDINTRVMITYNGSLGIPFRFPDDYTSLDSGDMNQNQIDDLLHNAPYAIDTTDASEQAANQAFGESLVNYLRGDFTNEGSQVGDFRRRGGQRLGDIIHSAPVFVGAPDPLNYPNDIEDTAYQAWALDNADRRQMLYVGANDGALHGFDAVTGAEVVAYFPEAVFSDEDRWGLHWLADQSYEHRYYVDADPAVEHVFIDTGTGDAWHTVLVGGLRGGGRAIYAMDVTDPGDFSDESSAAGQVLWEFTHDDLGYTFAKPTIAKLNDGRWAAILGNGYNPGPNSDGEAKLFIKYLDTASPSFRVLTTGVGSINNSDCLDADSNCNGLSTPAVIDLGTDRVADRVYAGDLQGNLWVFDISSNATTDWGSAYGTAETPQPLFTAKSADDVAQPITSQPLVTLHPTKRLSATNPNTLVFFGTGQYIAENDPLSTGDHSFYGIWDHGSRITGSRDSVLVDQTSTQDSSVGSKPVRLLTNHPVQYDESGASGSVVLGWYYDLPDDKERVIVNPLLFGDLVVYTTMVPSTNLCSTSAGYSWLMVHNLIDGTEPDFIALDVSGDGVFDENDQVGDSNVAGVRSGNLYWQPSIVKSDKGSIGTLLIPTDSDEGIETIKLQGNINTGARSSWGLYRFE